MFTRYFYDMHKLMHNWAIRKTDERVFMKSLAGREDYANSSRVKLILFRVGQLHTKMQMG